MGVGDRYGNSLLLAKNGTLLTWGKRLGSDQYPLAIKVKEDINAVMLRLDQHLGLFGTKSFDTDACRIDATPIGLWELPSKTE